MPGSIAQSGDSVNSGSPRRNRRGGPERRAARTAESGDATPTREHRHNRRGHQVQPAARNPAKPPATGQTPKTARPGSHQTHAEAASHTNAPPFPSVSASPRLSGRNAPSAEAGLRFGPSPRLRASAVETPCPPRRVYALVLPQKCATDTSRKMACRTAMSVVNNAHPRGGSSGQAQAGKGDVGRRAKTQLRVLHCAFYELSRLTVLLSVTAREKRLKKGLTSVDKPCRKAARRRRKRGGGKC
jgi:hypothetical protein